MGFFVFLVVFFLSFFVIVFLANLINKKRRDKLKELTGVFSGRLKSGFYDLTFEGNFQGLKFLIVLVPGGQNSTESLKITLFKNCDVTFNISFESLLTGFGKKLGFVHEVKINDPMFDKNFFVSSKTPEVASGHLNNENVRLAIKELLVRGFEPLSVDSKKIFSKKDYYDLENDLKPEYIKSILHNLNLLAR